MACQKCEDRGFYYDRNPEKRRLKLCSCVEQKCRCGGRKPYQYFDDRLEARWCPCRPYRLALRSAERIFSESGVPMKYRGCLLDDFKEQAPDGTGISGAHELKGLVGSLLDRCQNGESAARGLLLWGVPGNGKTMLCCIGLNELMLRSGKPGKFLDLSLEYFQKLRGSYSKESGNYGRSTEIIEELIEVPFLVIDDFGVQRDTDWEQEMLYNLVDARYQEERVTLVTTNKNIDDFRELADGRIYSRFLEMFHIVHVQSPDYRTFFERVF